MIATGDDRAFNRGLRIVAGLAALIVVVVMIVVFRRDHPLLDSPVDRTNDGAAVQASDTGPLPHAGTVPDNTSGVVQHPGKSQSDLPSGQ